MGAGYAAISSYWRVKTAWTTIVLSTASKDAGRVRRTAVIGA
jgi:hypothetical protein